MIQIRYENFDMIHFFFNIKAKHAYLKVHILILQQKKMINLKI